MNDNSQQKGGWQNNNQRRPHDETELDPTNPDNIEVATDGSVSDLEAKSEQYLSGWKRALADYVNLQKRAGEERDNDRRRVRAQVAESLLPVIDNFGLVTKHAPDLSTAPEDVQKKFATWYMGITLIDKQFTDALAELGITPIVAVGQPFDPNLHDASSSKHIEGTEPGLVIEELIRGWKLNDLVLRPAQVVVSE